MDKQAYMEHFREVTYSMLNGVLEMVKHPDGSSEVVYANEAARSLLCTPEENAADKLLLDPYAFVYPADKTRVMEAIAACRDHENVKETYRVLDKDGQVIWVLAHFHSLHEGEDLHIVIIYSNISELMTTQARLSSEGAELLNIINSIPLGLAIFEIAEDGKGKLLSLNDQMITFANNIGKTLDGNARNWSKEELTILFNQSIYAFCDNSDAILVAKMLKDSETMDTASCIFRLRGSTLENPIYVKATCCSKPATETTRTFYVIYENVTEDRLRQLDLARKQEQLMTLSYIDTLTKVKNRNSYNALVKETRKNPLKKSGLLFADLNGLKKVNDEIGHLYGDDMIRRFAEILNEFFEEDNIYRISGDEFVCVCPGVERRDFVNRMGDLIREIEKNDDIASVGYVWEDVMPNIKLSANQAEQIMYVEKQRFYEKEKNLHSKHRPMLLNSLLADFENGRFQMYLQPKADINSSKVIGAEALVRKIDESGRVVSPFEFIPQLEKERLIPKIDFFMLEEVCRFLSDLQKKGKTDFKVSVNMSRVTLVENNYIDTIEEIVGKYDFDVSQLEFEITESNETMDNLRLEDYIGRIKALGIGISLDDVGTEYSSMPMLLMEGIDCVKLDRSLILQATSDKARMLLKMLIEVCHKFGMKVIAEGVETDDVREILSNMDCDLYQGYLMSKPIPEKEFEALYLN